MILMAVATELSRSASRRATSAEKMTSEMEGLVANIRRKSSWGRTSA